MKFKGKVIQKLDKSGVSKKDNTPFKSFSYVIEETEGQYPQKGVFDTFGDKVEDLNIGDVVEIDYNLRANEWQGKWFGSNQIWKVTKEANSSPEPSPVVAPPAPVDTGNLPF